jgi:hypothetical protein
MKPGGVRWYGHVDEFQPGPELTMIREADKQLKDARIYPKPLKGDGEVLGQHPVELYAKAKIALTQAEDAKEAYVRACKRYRVRPFHEFDEEATDS